MPTPRLKKKPSSGDTNGLTLRRMVRRLEIQNSILLGYDVFHVYRKDGPAYAWSRGNEINFNAKMLPAPKTPKDIMFITGVNNHELAHVMYTPTLAELGELHQRMQYAVSHRADFRHYFNVLEDQRIEMLKAKRHSRQEAYFRVMCYRLFREHPQYSDSQYLLAYGRKYLPLKLRRRLRKAFKYPHLIPGIRRIIDSYLKLNLFNEEDCAKAFTLVEDLTTMLTPVDKKWPPDSCDVLSGMTTPTRDIKAKFYEAEVPKPREPSDEELRQIQGDVDRLTDAVDGDDSAIQDDADGFSDADPGTGSGGADTSLHDELKELEDEATDEDSFVRQEVAAVERYIRRRIDVDFKRLRETLPVPDDLPILARKISQELKRKEAEADPYWERQTTSGKLDSFYAMRHPEDLEHSYRRWEDSGTTGTDQEWVVLLDCSWSMSNSRNKLNRAGWLLKRAADLAGVRMTVIAYGDLRSEPRTVYRVDQKAEVDKIPKLIMLANTEPSSAVNAAHSILTESKALQKGFFVMTDGSWDQRNLELGKPDDVIADMTGRGINTHLCFVSSADRDEDTIPSHGCATRSTIKGLESLPMVAKELMKTMLGKKR